MGKKVFLDIQNVLIIQLNIKGIVCKLDRELKMISRVDI